MKSADMGYAEALLKAAVECGSVKRVADELFAVASLVSQTPAFFYNPRIASREHEAVLLGALGGQVDELTLEFIILLASRRLLKVLPAIQLRFDELANKAIGEVKVSLRVPYEPSAQLIEELVDFLAENGLFPQEKRSGARVDVAVDKSLIGGFCAEYAGRVFDASIKNRLHQAYPKWSQGA